MFEPPVALQSLIQYHFDAFIRGQPSWKGLGGLSRVHHVGVLFCFVNEAEAEEREDTTVSKGQFSEFVFTVD